MAYVVFARKYRPQAFDEVVGQEHITTTLKNAIALDRVAHAYLFAGPRGIGKTTTARIFAKALNCELGPTPAPCNRCTHCLEITRGSHLDILEIDAASNRGIDEVRSVRENVKFSPSRARFKIYIIDEVHMLTTEAFNALLKTLEEPPPHVKFIFATTQPQRVPLTILSRCQRFDFRRISNAGIIESLKEISKKEALSVDDEALALIAAHADGSMRDAEVMLDQIASFTQGKVSGDDVTKMLGGVDADILFRLVDAIASKDASSALQIVDELIRNGKDPVQLLTNLVEHLRNVLVARVAKSAPSLADSSSDTVARLIRAGEPFSVEEILYSLYALSGAIDLAKKTSLTRIPLEIALVKLCERSHIVSLDEILKRLKGLEGTLATRPSPPVTPRRAEEGPASAALRAAPPAELPNEDPAGPPAKAAVGPAEEPATGPPVTHAEGRDKSLGEILRSWQAVLNNINAKKISVASYLQEGTLHAVENGTIVISFPKACRFHKESLEANGENKALIEESISEVLTSAYRVRFLVLEDGSDDAPSPPREPRSGMNNVNRNNGPRPEGGKASKKIDPAIEYAIDIFDGQLLSREKVSPKDKP